MIKLTALTLLAGAGFAQQQIPDGYWPAPRDQGPTAPKISCEDLRSLSSKDLTITYTKVEPAQGRVPEHCRVGVVVPPAIRVEVSLPTKWNGRFHMTGNGGYAGDAPDGESKAGTRRQSMLRGFVWAGTDTGHDQTQEPQATFAKDRRKLIDYGSRSLHVTVETAHRLMNAYYGKGPVRSYYSGCSTGGRQGLMFAQRFPQDFDGIAVTAPVVDFSGTMLKFACDGQALANDPIPASKQALLAEKIYAQCDAKDGVKDGVIEDPRKCGFDPARDLPVCAAGTDDPSCFTKGQIQVLQKIYGALVSKGKKLYPDWPVGAEADLRPNGGWSTWFLGPKSTEVQMSESFFQYVVANPPDPSFNLSKFNFDRDAARLGDARKIIDAVNSDLTAFQRRGGKLLMAQGWADQALNPMMSIEYYDRVKESMGSTTASFVRLYMVPGMFHCGGGVGTGLFDMLTAVVKWVEQGNAPGRMIGTRVDDGKVVRTRPLCPYPQAAKYNGSGSTDDAANFSCAAPGK